MKQELNKELLDKIAGGRIDFEGTNYSNLDLYHWMVNKIHCLSDSAQNEIINQCLDIVDDTSDEVYTFEEAKAALSATIDEAKKREGLM